MGFVGQFMTLSPLNFSKGLRELSLFSGCGGGLLASRLLEWSTIGYVEREPYRCRVIAQRIADGFLDDAPIYCGDVREFICQGFAAAYQGVADIVSAGFPCQEFSLANYIHAGAQTAGTGDKNHWPETIEVIRQVRPKYCLLENVVGLTGGHGYFGRVLSDLAQAGYDARWDCLSGNDIGAPHVRQRIWIVARQVWKPVVDAADMLECEACGEPWCPECEAHYGECECIGPHQDDLYEYRQISGQLQAKPKNLAHANGKRFKEHKRARTVQQEHTTTERNGVRGRWWRDYPGELGQTNQSRFCRVADGVARGMDRLAALGDGQIPGVAALAWQRMMEQVA